MSLMNILLQNRPFAKNDWSFIFASFIQDSAVILRGGLRLTLLNSFDSSFQTFTGWY
jgi:hypothetical protein